MDETDLVREAAIALGSMRTTGPDLVVACRRIVERHPEVGALWWLCARLLTAPEPSRLAWQLADEVERDRTPRVLANAIPEDATVLTIGWPSVTGAALVRRGDVRVLCADSGFHASSFMRLLERADVACDPVPAEALARAAAIADLVVLDAVAASPRRVLAPIGSHVVAAVASSVGIPVWCALGLGRRLPVEYVDAIAGRVLAGPETFDLEIDELPLALVTHVVTAGGLSMTDAAAITPECPFAPELLRSSPI